MTKATRRAGALGSALALLMTSVPSIASTFLAMEIPDLAAHSDAVVRAEVMSVESFWDAGRRVILTDARLRIDEKLAGELGHVGQEITVRTFGGVVGGYEVVAHGFPTFEAGEEVVVFLGKQADRTLQVTGYQLGHYEVLVRGGVEVAVPTWDGGATLLGRDGKNVDGPVAIELQELRDLLRFMTSTPN